MDSTKRIRRVAAAGFTLVELLIATSILLVVLATAMYGYQLYQAQWQRNLSKIDNGFQQLRRYDLVSTALHGIVPYMVASNQQQSFYFLGRTEGFTAVTVAPVFNPGAPAVIRVFKEIRPDGKYQLVYEEASLAEAPLVYAEQQLPFAHRLVVSEDQLSIEFSYFTETVLDINQRIDDAGNFLKTNYQWLPEHDALISRTHPVRVSINLSGFNWQLPVAERTQSLLNRSDRSLDFI